MRRTACVFLLSLIASASAAWADVVVIVRREAQTAGNYVRVCDIARVDGPADQAREVAMIVLGPAPAGGETQEITRWDIETRLYEMGVAARIVFSGNDVVRVFPAGAAPRRYEEDSLRSLGSYPSQRAESPARDPADAPANPVTRLDSLQSGRRNAAAPAAPAPGNALAERRDGGTAEGDTPARARVAQTVGDYFADKYRAGGAGRQDIEVAAKIVGSVEGVAPGAYELRVENAEGKIPGRAKVTLFVREDAADAGRTIAVAADTEVYGLALVPVRSISRGETLKAGDVRVDRVRMEWGASYLPPKPAAVAGRVAAQALRPGAGIRPEDTTVGEAVKRNQLVIVDTAGKGWRLQAKAKAQGGGAVGDVITVEDMETRARYPARITAPGSVSVIVNKDKLIYNRE